MNVVLVICESFSAYKSSMFGNKLDPTPYFKELCSQGLFYERCFTPAFGTARGVWATLTGIPDVQQPKTASRNPAAVDQHSIMSDFKGYEKFYFLGGSTTWANIRGVLKNNIDGLRIVEQEDFQAGQVDVWGISDKNLFLESNKMLAKQDKPFFAIIQTADNHRPYTIPEEDLGLFKKMNYPKDTLKKYGFEDNDQYNAFRYSDFCFRQFMEAAKKERYYDNTLFVFVGDHGLRGDAGEMFPMSFTKQGFNAEHVPLLFYSPRNLSPKTVRKVASQLDVMPTIASIVKQPHVNTTLGRDLTDTIASQKHYAFIADPDLLTLSLIGDDYAYIRHSKTGKESFVSVSNNTLPVMNAHVQKLFTEMSQLTSAWYETSKYILLNNKKIKK
jgi:phosphoglycerol transferase MdoB-like AlkP superfamily enzyme